MSAIPSGDVRVDVDALHGRAERQAALAGDASDCVAELRSGGFGEWWRDGRPNDLNARVADIADRLSAAACAVDDFTDGLRLRMAELEAADDAAARGLAGRR